MTDWIAGPRFKVKRAKEHLSNLEAAIDPFLVDPPPYGTFPEDEPDGGRAWRAKLIRADLPWLDWGCAVADVIHNLRSSLDVLVYQFLLASKCKPSPKLQFPIWESKQSFEAAGLTEVQRCSETAMDVIKAAKPYKGGGPLWALAALDNSDKHRVLTPAACASVHAKLDVTALLFGPPPPESLYPPFLMTLQEPIPSLLYDGAIFYRLPADYPDKMNVKPKFTFAIAFGEGEVLQGEPLIPTLQQMADVVNGIVEAFVNVSLGSPPRSRHQPPPR